MKKKVTPAPLTESEREELIRLRAENEYMRAAIYCNIGELAAMSSVLKEYSYFIENTIAKNASMLAQCDVNDLGAEIGTWNTRSRLSLNVDEFSKQIGTKEKVFYLGFEGVK